MASVRLAVSGLDIESLLFIALLRYNVIVVEETGECFQYFIHQYHRFQGPTR
jgi:hypothetical protein